MKDLSQIDCFNDTRGSGYHYPTIDFRMPKQPPGLTDTMVFQHATSIACCECNQSAIDAPLAYMS